MAVQDQQRRFSLVGIAAKHQAGHLSREGLHCAVGSVVGGLQQRRFSLIGIAAKHQAVHLSQEGLHCEAGSVVGGCARSAEEVFFGRHCGEASGSSP